MTEPTPRPRRKKPKAKDPVAVELGRRGGLASAKRPARERKAAASHAARARWDAQKAKQQEAAAS